MSKKECLNKDDWKLILDYLVHISSKAQLKSLIKHEDGIYNENPQAKKEAKSEFSSESNIMGHFNEKETLAMRAFDLIGKHAIKLTPLTYQIHNTEISAISVLDFHFHNSIKLLDLIANNSTPSQITAFLRTHQYPSINSIKPSEQYYLSDGESFIYLEKGKIKYSDSGRGGFDFLIDNVNNLYASGTNYLFDCKKNHSNETLMSL